MSKEKKRWVIRKIAGKLTAVHLSCRAFGCTTKRRTKREIERRRQIFDQTRPHHGEDLIRALEFENFMRDEYAKGER